MKGRKIKGKEQEAQLQPIPVEVALEILHTMSSDDPDNPNDADNILAKYLLDITELKKIPRFFVQPDGGVIYHSIFKRPMGFGQEPEEWKIIPHGS